MTTTPDSRPVVEIIADTLMTLHRREPIEPTTAIRQARRIEKALDAAGKLKEDPMTTTPEHKIPTPEEVRDIYIAAREGASTVDKAKAGLIGVYEAGRAAGLLGGDPTEERPYSEDVDHEYGAWETDDIEEHAFDMLAVVQHRRAAAGVAPREPSPVASAPTVGDDSGHCGDDDRGGRENGPEDEGCSHRSTVAGSLTSPAPSPGRGKLAARLLGDILDAVPDDNDMQHVLEMAAVALAAPPAVDVEKLAEVLARVYDEGAVESPADYPLQFEEAMQYGRDGARAVSEALLGGER